jgi:hypothetical protein
MARKCVKFGKSGGKKVCRKFSGTKARKKSSGTAKKSSKGRCLKWSKGRTRCMRRAK